MLYCHPPGIKFRWLKLKSFVRCFGFGSKKPKVFYWGHKNKKRERPKVVSSSSLSYLHSNWQEVVFKVSLDWKLFLLQVIILRIWQYKRGNFFSPYPQFMILFWPPLLEFASFYFGLKWPWPIKIEKNWIVQLPLGPRREIPAVFRSIFLYSLLAATRRINRQPEICQSKMIFRSFSFFEHA